ncbi:MAG TPA: family 20 glycosylhydrolase, partial [Prolixibacteraceae bacterium]|nr:family 20 glycosylhydrolase [Prolixibacteraceae bacterium]
MPQRIEWNHQQFDLADSTSRFIQRLVTHMEGVAMNPHEAYSLEVTADSLILTAITPTGLYRGMQTVRQLTTVEKGQRLVAGCTITDWPAFRIRGFMQDVGRNYQPLEMLKEQIDVLAAYKMNVFHFHMTEDPGWRLESKIYPQLGQPATMSRWPGRLYTQNEFRELVAYCQERHITLIPEFDVPGHSTAFRKAMGFETMSDPGVQPVLIALVDELCSLAPADIMPYIHIGTDEVWHNYEKPSPTLLPALVDRITTHHGREVVVWRPGQAIATDSVSITHLWSSNGHPKPGHRYLDARLNYLNHLDPLAGIAQLYFERISGAPHGDSLRLGGILCNWNDNLVADPYDVILHNPVYPGIVTYSETSWTGQSLNFGEQYLAQFPPVDDEAFIRFVHFEERLIAHRDRYFTCLPFPYVRQTNMEWRIAG